MIELKKSLGGMSDQIPAQLLPGTKNPNLIIFSKKNSLYLWNPKTKVILAVLEEVNEISKKITNLKLSRTKNSKIITIIAGLSCGKILSQGIPAWNCRTCQIDDSCIICKTVSVVYFIILNKVLLRKTITIQGFF